MELVKAKKHLGQHFLNDESIAFEIVNALNEKCTTKNVLEVGPGMGVLTQYLLKNESFQTWAIDIDLESVKWLKEHFSALQEIGKIYGLTRMRICQIEKMILKKIKDLPNFS